MDFSREYLYEKFRKSYEEALSAKNVNDLARAKRLFYEAADYMERLAECGGEERKSRHAQALRIRKIADAIIPSRYADYGDVPISMDAPAPQSLYPVGGAGEKEGGAVPTGMEQYFTFFRPDELEGFESVIGLEEAKAAVEDYVINPIRYPEAYSYNFLDNKAILLEGPPGTGKTTFAKAVAKEIDQPFALVNVSALVNCLVGETGKNIDKVFAFLRAYAEQNDCGVTVFFDELDEIGKARGSDDKTSEAAVPALLRNLDGVAKNKRFLILANTNRKDLFDAALAERFRKLIHIPLPDETLREKLFAAKLSDVEEKFMSEIDLGEAAARSEGLSGRDITFICDDFKYLLAKIKAGLAEGTPMDALLGLVRKRMDSKR